MLGRLRGGTAGAVSVFFALVGATYGALYVGCTDYITLAPPDDASDSAVLEDVENPPLPSTEAGGEPQRPEGGTTLPRTDASSDASDAG